MTKSILVLNCGSSSIKFSLISSSLAVTLLSGVAENLFSSDAQLTIKQDNNKQTASIAHAKHQDALTKIIDAVGQLLGADNEIVAIGHRVVHGGEHFKQSCLIDEQVVSAIKACNELAPLHNPANLAGIEAIRHAFPELPQVAVFDTSFHQSLPEKAYLYALPYRYYQQHGVRRYGFHGTSYRYIYEALDNYLDITSHPKIIVAHLGNGSSVTAIEGGKAIDTSMGFTPMAGLVQGTRSGDIDPSLVDFLATKTQQSAGEITDVLWKKSGLLGLSEATNDCRTLEESAQRGDKPSQRALDVYVHYLIKTIASYSGVLNGLDALVFTGGIGENSSYIRQQTCLNLQYLGVILDPDKNAAMIRGQSGAIHCGKTPTLVITTDEELMIAKDTANLVQM